MAMARAKLHSHLQREGISVNALARETGARQYTIWRFLAGRTKTVTPDVRHVLEQIEPSINGITQDIAQDERIRQALVASWDGSEEGIQLIARTLTALAPLLRAAQRSTPCRVAPPGPELGAG